MGVGSFDRLAVSISVRFPLPLESEHWLVANGNGPLERLGGVIEKQAK